MDTPSAYVVVRPGIPTSQENRARRLSGHVKHREDKVVPAAPALIGDKPPARGTPSQERTP